MYKYCKSNISYELGNVKAFAYLNFKKFHKEMSSTESEMYNA